jgi:hypothetical protein
LYEANNLNLQEQENFFVEAYKNVWTEFKHIFDATLTNRMARGWKMEHKIPSDVNVLISQDKERINLLYNNYYTMDIVLRGYINMLRDHQVYLTRLIKFLQTKYDD